MTDNKVLQFRRPEKKPDPKPARRREMPGWAPWAGFVGLAVIIYLVQHQFPL